MKETGFGRFVFFGSSGITGEPPKGMASYLVAKEALWGYTKAISMEIAQFGITTNLVSPSLTITDLTRDVPLRIKELEALRSPTRRLAKVEDSAELVSFLCSTEAGFINGLNIPVAGGLFR
jgi:NAD(P)-dependent dehydrogenase (short-subunit alcohol dehydrogenase family)